MTRWTQLEAVDLSFFETAQHRFEYALKLGASADEVWDAITGDQAFSWCRLLTHVEYTSPGPREPGSTRSSEVAWGALKFRERFLVWDDAARRQTFFVEQMSLPLARSFAEDLEVTPGEAGSELRWGFAFDSASRLDGLVRVGLPAIRALLGSFARDTEKHFGALPALSRAR